MGSPKGVRRLKPVSTPKPQEGLRLDLIEGDQAMGQFSRLLDQGFGVRPPGHFFDDFPIWDEKLGLHGERMIRIGVWDGPELVSCAGVRLGKLKASRGELDVALIGAVVTSPEYRGQGLASRTVSLAVEWARERDSPLVVLWGGEQELYTRLGFELCGEQIRMKICDLDLGPQIRDFSQVTLGRGWISTLMDFLQARETGLRIDRSDESWLEAHKNVDWYWLGDPETPRAYAAIGRGIDLTGLVHEWGGKSVDDLKCLLQLIRLEHPDSQLLANAPLMSAWKLGEPTVAPEFLCMARALEIQKVINAFGVRLAADDPLLTTPNAAACRALFGPSDLAESDGRGRLPLWIWGLDAV